MNLRRATVEDIPAMLPMAGEFHRGAGYRRVAPFEECVAGWEKRIADSIALGNRLCLVVETDSGLAGFMLAIVGPFPFDERFLMACETVLWVNESERGRGYGRAMLRALKEWGREQGCTHALAGSQRRLGMKGVSRLLEDEGFEVEEKHHMADLRGAA